ncbi:hypothetical protein [uncultured Sphingomonas sp.]|uniref:hypothetical protein n=1 Tax=uncultured Sphingomonas sp. TaxID=158754 RepID=UPI001576CD67
MLKKRIAIAQHVADRLTEAERSNDLALLATARLAITMIESRLELNAAAMVGQDAFAAVAATFERQSDSRQQLVNAHSALHDAKALIGLREFAVGGGGDKQVPSGSAALAIVARQAA